MRRVTRICGLLACLISLATITQVAPRGAMPRRRVPPRPLPSASSRSSFPPAALASRPARVCLSQMLISPTPARITTARPDLPIADLQAGSVSGCDGGAWSPDGTRVAVARNMYLHMLQLSALAELPGQQPVAVMNSSGEPISVGSPVWSPDGQWIAFHDGDGLALVRPDGTGYRQLVSLSTNWYPIREPEFSPDGRSRGLSW